MHASLSHPNIISAYLGMEDATGVKLFMEYAGDSDAYSYINAKQRLCLREDDARQLVADVLTALQYMHSQVRGGLQQRSAAGGCGGARGAGWSDGHSAAAALLQGWVAMSVLGCGRVLHGINRRRRRRCRFLGRHPSCGSMPLWLCP